MAASKDRAPATTILLEIWRIARRSGVLLDEALAPAGMTGSDFGLYSQLMIEGPMTPTELSRRSGMPPTTVSQVVRRLEERGHLRRSRNPRDGRSASLTLTAAGRKAHAKAAPAFVGVYNRLLDALGPEADQVLVSLIRLDDALASASGEDASRAPGTPANVRRLIYHGPPLTPDEEKQVREYLDFVRWRRSGAQSARRSTAKR